MESKTYSQLYEELQYFKEENKRLHSRVQELEKQLQQSKGTNPRNAGRRSCDQKWLEKFAEFVRLKNENQSRDEIIRNMGISRATYFRYQKLFNEIHSGFSDQSI